MRACLPSKFNAGLFSLHSFPLPFTDPPFHVHFTKASFLKINSSKDRANTLAELAAVFAHSSATLSTKMFEPLTSSKVKTICLKIEFFYLLKKHNSTK